VVSFEGWRSSDRYLLVMGSILVMFGGELFIAMTQPSDMHAYTLPLAAYLVGLGLSFRRSEPLFGRHMEAHEFLFLAGAAVLVLPSAWAAFQPDGGLWGIVTIIEGLGLVALGLVLLQRWLVAPGVLTIVGAAGRFILTGESRLPAWATIGLVGLALLGIGVLLLLERDWWDRTRLRLAHWWLNEPNGTSHTPVQ
jgi:hypothetical protein